MRMPSTGTSLPSPSKLSARLGVPGLVADEDQVFGVHEQAAVAGFVAALGQREDLAAALLPAALGGETLARLDGRAVVGLHEHDVLLGGIESPRVLAAGELELDPGALEQPAHVLLVAPERGRGREAGRRRQVAAHDLEQLADLTLGGPVDEGDASAGPADARELV